MKQKIKPCAGALRQWFLALLVPCVQLCVISEMVLAQPFEKEYLGCAPGSSGENCAKQWKFSGGPGYVGQRPGFDTKIMCSPSCTDLSKPKECSLILALHGIYSNPYDQEWLMLGSPDSETWIETEEYGGPFCISFHKSEDFPWDYSCDYRDADHLHGFILWARDEWPIHHDAVFLHGFSSGAIMTSTLMHAHCKIEPLIAAAAPYAGLIRSPPTTKAAFLVVHPTHDNIVPYREDWIDGASVPSCACNGLDGVFPWCFDGYIDTKGPTLAASMAIHRGYEGDVFKDYPPVTKTLDIIDSDQERCQQQLDACFNLYEFPNPFNEDYDCTQYPDMETDVIEFTFPEKNAGPIVLWKINMWNHDYPNKRRSQYGTSEFFYQMRKFFYQNRVRYTSKLIRTVSQVSTGQLCADPTPGEDPNSIAFPSHFLRYDYWFQKDPATPERCREICQEDFRCRDAFFVDYRGYAWVTGCKIYYDSFPCLSTYPELPQTVHFKASDPLPTTSPGTNSPTDSPAPTPLETPAPSPSETPAPTELSFCSSSQIFDGTREAGYACLIDEVSVGDSNFDFDLEQCNDINGEWVPYDCFAALAFYKDSPEDYFVDVWGPKCCIPSTPTVSPAPSSEISLCTSSETFDGSPEAGYACLIDEVSVGDSNFDFDLEQCNDINGEWVPYDCFAALAFYEDSPEDYLVDVWGPKCCFPSSPTDSPITLPPIFMNCPIECSVPTCTWLGTDGPGWNSTWERDEDGKQTKNGFCTHYCGFYDETHALCGDGDWHKDGIDCTGCADIAENPVIPPEDREGASGLCASVDSLSGHALWGKGVKECGGGPEATNDSRCTVYQAMNGDEITNPDRTCRSFCTSFGLTCQNGYDDGENGCVYGGPGIGCDSILGCCSVGGPTPDHVCVCGEALPTSNPSESPTTSNPTSIPSKTPSRMFTSSPTSNPSIIPSISSTTTPSESPTICVEDPNQTIVGIVNEESQIFTTCHTLKQNPDYIPLVCDLDPAAEAESLSPAERCPNTCGDPSAPESPDTKVIGLVQGTDVQSGTCQLLGLQSPEYVEVACTLTFEIWNDYKASTKCPCTCNQE